MNYAGVDKRAFAGFIDALIVYASFFILAVIISRTIGESVLILFLMLLAAAAYTQLMCASKYQATVGMRLFKLRMANIDGAPVITTIINTLCPGACVFYYCRGRRFVFPSL